MRTEHWLNRVNLFKNQLPEIPKHAYLFLGDSITEEFPLEKFFPEWIVINRGISGDHIDGVIERIDNSAIALKPELLFLMIGVNDIGDGRSDEYIQKRYTELLGMLSEHLTYTQIYIQSILPVGRNRGKIMLGQIQKINDFLLKYCSLEKLQFINLFKHFLDKEGWLQNTLTNDGLHLNGEGYALWADILKKTLQKEIG